MQQGGQPSQHQGRRQQSQQGPQHTQQGPQSRQQTPQSQQPRQQTQRQQGPPQQRQSQSMQPTQQGRQSQQPQGQQRSPQSQQVTGQSMQQPGQSMQLGGGQSQQMGGAELETVSLDEIIQTDVVTAEEDTDVREVIQQMEQQDVGSVVVVDDDQQPQGVVTDRKIALSLQETPNIIEQTADELVEGDVTTGDTEMTVFEAINELSEDSIRRLPVTDEDGNLVGIVTLDDIIVLLATEMDTAADIIETQSPRL